MLSHLSPSDRATLSLSYGDYLRFSQLMQDRFGLYFPEKRRMELEIGVRRAFASSTCPDLDSYFKTLQDPAHGEMEIERLVNALTVGETHFFRDAGQIDALANTVLPELIEKRRPVRSLRIWSAGCASGEEPYTIAMLLRDLLPDVDTWSITILATDINTQNLERAKHGMYGEWAFRETRSKTARPRFFVQHGNQYELSPVVRKMVHFSELNLAEDVYPSYENNTMYMDLILCRNVTIYFPEAVTRMVVDRYFNSLVDGGWLVIGHSEHSLNIYQRFQVRNFPDAILYQRLSEQKSLTDQKPLVDPWPFTSQPLQIDPRSPTEQRSPLLERLASNQPSSDKPVFPARSDAFSPAMSIKTEFKSQTPLRSGPDLPPPTDRNGDFEQAQTMMSFGKVDEARDLLLRWLSNNPNHAPGCALLGNAYANLGNWPEADRWCRMAIAIDRLNLEAYYTLALVFQHQHQAEQALEMMKRVVYIERNDILGHFSLADLYHGSGQTAQALKSLENARRLLDTRPADEMIPRSGDVTVSRLSQTVTELQQLWAAELNRKS